MLCKWRGHIHINVASTMQAVIALVKNPITKKVERLPSTMQGEKAMLGSAHCLVIWPLLYKLNKTKADCCGWKRMWEKISQPKQKWKKKNNKNKKNICFMHVSCLYDLFLRGHNIFTTGFHIYFWEGMQNLWCDFFFFSREAAWKATFDRWCFFCFFFPHFFLSLPN